ncbi:RNA polymerase sigma factor RpoD [Cellulomonas sp. T2.31MG-18]|uniref:hypothetical protein n=1 Tax=Cellulomonas sp. T2.31MG-18 TaxID=3157619 RepID=UPI0035EBB4D2
MTIRLPEDLEPHADAITGNDPRFFVLPAGVSLRQAVDQDLLPEEDLTSAITTAQFVLADTLEGAMDYLVWRTYIATFGRAPTPEWSEGVKARFGLNGPPATLEEAGKLVGVTRERVRQVTAKLEPKLRGRWLPQMVAVLRALVEQSPVAEPVGRQLPAGLATLDLTAAQVLKFVELLNVDVAAVTGTTLKVGGGWLVDEREALVTDAARVASKHTSKFGMTTAENVRQELSTPTVAADIEDVLRVLRKNSGVRWAGEWLWVVKDEATTYTNSMVNQLKSMLSVNSPQTIESLHEGLRRNQKFRQRDIVPPGAAMLEFIKASKSFRLTDDGLVESVIPLDYHQVQGPIAAIMIDVLKAVPGEVMDRNSLMEAWLAVGAAPGTAGVWTTYAEWMDNYGTNVWGLRGAHPSPALVDEIQRAAKARLDSEAHRTDWAWASDGGLLLTMDVSTSFLLAGAIGFEDHLRQQLGERTFTVGGPNGTPIGQIRTSEKHAWTWGWHKVFGAYGVKVGDVMQVHLDTVTSTATAIVGGRELWTS